MKILEQLNQARAAVEVKCPSIPKIVVVLGSGLSRLADVLDVECEIPFSEIPHVKSSTVSGHEGKFVIGKLNGVRVTCMKGRLHLYEGYDVNDVVFPHRLLAFCGAQLFWLTNAAGGMRDDLVPGDLVLLSDHINALGINPLIGPNEDELGSRFPDMSFGYDPSLRKIILEVSNSKSLGLKEGVYIALSGPNYETPQEVSVNRFMGADVSGMSTVPECIALNHMGKRVVAVSCVTNLAAGISGEKLNHQEVLETGEKVSAKFEKLVALSLPLLEKSL